MTNFKNNFLFLKKLKLTLLSPFFFLDYAEPVKTENDGGNYQFNNLAPSVANSPVGIGLISSNMGNNNFGGEGHSVKQSTFFDDVKLSKCKLFCKSDYLKKKFRY